MDITSILLKDNGQAKTSAHIICLILGFIDTGFTYVLSSLLIQNQPGEGSTG